MSDNQEKIPEVEALVERVSTAQRRFEEFTQAQVDAVVKAVADAAYAKSGELAQTAVEETGFGRIEDKIIKNNFACRELYNYIKDMKTVGVIASYEAERIAEVAAPVGVILSIIPSTNPTSTAIYKALISLKSRNGTIFSPHPSAKKCIKYTADILLEAAVRAGAPDGIIACLEHPTMEATTALMTHPGTAMILATGGMGLVRAAYSAGKPAFGVGPGNVPAYVDRSADVEEAVRCILVGKAFDWGTVCSSEQSIIADEPVYDKVVQELKRRKAYLCTDDEVKLVEKTVVKPNLAVNPEIVGKSPVYIAQKAGFDVPRDTTTLVIPYNGVGKDYPLSIEKLSPVIALYRADGWQKGCERCMEILHFGGLGHTISVHCKDEEIIRQFALKKPASRILVNTSSTHGAIGYTTNLPPSLTLGCGPIGGNITSDNITPLHLVTVKRLAYSVSRPDSTIPALKISDREAETAESERTKFIPGGADRISSAGESIKRETVEKVVDSFLQGKTGMGKVVEETEIPNGTEEVPSTDGLKKSVEDSGIRDEEEVYDFVSENDVQRAILKDRKIKISKNTIITPLAEEMGKKYKIFLIV